VVLLLVPAPCFSFTSFLLQRKSLIALEKEEEEERNKTIESLKTALRTKPMRQLSSFPCFIALVIAFDLYSLAEEF